MHSVGGWGTLAAGLLGDHAGEAQFVSRLIGVLAGGATTYIGALVIFDILKATIGIRMSQQEKVENLDIGEHGMSACPDFAPSSFRGL